MIYGGRIRKDHCMRTVLEKLAESVTTRLDWLIGASISDRSDEGELMLSAADQEHVARLTQTVAQIKDAFVPVTPRPDFRARLKQSLLAAAGQRLAAQEESRVSALRRRWVIIGAAAGSALSVFGIVMAVLVHQRTIRL
jgi:anti-sigma-K factor RskA